jgi:hypothetical protein
MSIKKIMTISRWRYLNGCLRCSLHVLMLLLSVEQVFLFDYLRIMNLCKNFLPTHVYLKGFLRDDLGA